MSAERQRAGGPPPRRTVIKFTRMLDAEPPGGRSAPPSPAAPAERSAAAAPTLSRLAAVKKYEKDKKIFNKMKAEEKIASPSKVTAKCKPSHKKKPHLLEPTVPTTVTPKTTISSLTTSSDVKFNEKLNRNEKQSIKSNERIIGIINDSKLCSQLHLAKRKSSSNKVDTFMKTKASCVKVFEEKVEIEQEMISAGQLSYPTVAQDQQPSHSAKMSAAENSNSSFCTNSETSQSHIKSHTKSHCTERHSRETSKYDARKIEILTEPMKQSGDVDLRVPGLSLTKEVKHIESWTENLESHSLPDLQLPPFKISARGNLKQRINGQLYSEPSVVIGEATVTYTHEKKINIHVVGRSAPAPSGTPPAPLPFTALRHNEIYIQRQTKPDEEFISTTKMELYKRPDDIFFHKSSSFIKNNNVKPSDVIWRLRHDSLVDAEFLSEQFRKEFNFVESFLESLQYLEGSRSVASESQPESCDSLHSLQSLDSTDSSRRSSRHCLLVSKLGTAEDEEDQHNRVMANNSLCLLNLMIKDEHRRAKNLLFVLKMREDALKDFTKSQILWLENQKRSDETGASRLKKKQRGVLLKLQQECGEMQRMKEALLAFSQRRRGALARTRRRLQLRLAAADPLPPPISPSPSLTLRDTTLAEGVADSHQTRNSPEPTEGFEAVRSDTSTAEHSKTVSGEPPRHSVKVDGAYLNILFHSLALPGIFTGGKEYEVNESALRNILQSGERPSCAAGLHIGTVAVPEGTASDSSGPSTARSLLDELGDYFRCPADRSTAADDTTSGEPSELGERDPHLSVTADTVENPTVDTHTVDIGASDIKPDEDEVLCKSDSSNAVGDIDRNSEDKVPTVEATPGNSSKTEEGATGASGVVVGRREAGAERPGGRLDPAPASSPPKAAQLSAASTHTGGGVVVAAPSLSEEEELKRKQLAIELEIKALEQQQSLLLVREIPDKPPPPYTPPGADAAPPRPAPAAPAAPAAPFADSRRVHDAVQAYVEGGSVPASVESLELVRDLCAEGEARGASRRRAGEAALAALGASGARAPGPPVLARRADHIDRALLAEWTRREAEWTALEAGEAGVKGQLCSDLLRALLDESIAEYRGIRLTACSE